MEFNSTFKIILLTLISVSVTNGYLLYGDTCDPTQEGNPDQECDRYFGLTCRENICNCSNPEDMTFSPALGSCVTLVGAECQPNKITKEQYESYLPCTSGASCQYSDSVLTCTCRRPTAETSDRRCSSSIRELCEENKNCDQRELLVCSHGFCQCPNPLDQDYTPGEYLNGSDSTCFVRMGAPCDPKATEGQMQCEKDKSVCTQDANSPTGFSCACHTANGWLADFSRRCKKGYLQACHVDGYADNVDDATGECNTDAGLMCFKDQCVCLYEPDQIWDEKQQLCASLEGKQCTLIDDAGNLLCHTGLECTPFRGPLDGICRKPTEETTETKSSSKTSENTPTSTTAKSNDGNSRTLQFSLITLPIFLINIYSLV